MDVRNIQASSYVETMTKTTDYHLGFEGSLAFGSKHVGHHEGEIVHDEIEGAGRGEALVFVDVGDYGLEGGVGCEDEKEENAQLDGLNGGVVEHRE